LEDDFGGMVVNGEVRNYIEQVLSFSESAETFEISTMAQLSSSDGLSFLVKVPENYLELLNRGNQIVDMHNIGVGIISYTYEDYFLMLNQTSDLNDYGSSKVNLFGYKLLTWSGVIKPKKKTSGSTTKKKTTSTKKKSTGTKK